MSILTFKIIYDCPKCKRRQTQQYNASCKNFGDLPAALAYNYCELCSQNLDYKDVRLIMARPTDGRKVDLF